jgi:hypothetical protein
VRVEIGTGEQAVVVLSVGLRATSDRLLGERVGLLGAARGPRAPRPQNRSQDEREVRGVRAHDVAAASPPRSLSAFTRLPGPPGANCRHEINPTGRFLSGHLPASSTLSIDRTSCAPRARCVPGSGPRQGQARHRVGLPERPRDGPRRVGVAPRCALERAPHQARCRSCRTLAELCGLVLAT